MFADWLAELPLASWLDIGRALAADRDQRSARCTAWAILDAAIADRGLCVAAWYVRDAVDTSALLALGGDCHGSLSERRTFAIAHRAAEEAALALLACEQLPANDFAVLYEPFARLRTRVTPRPGASGI